MMKLLQAVDVALTIADWDSRHLQVVLALIFIFASGSVAWLMDRLASIRDKQAWLVLFTLIDVTFKFSQITANLFNSKILVCH